MIKISSPFLDLGKRLYSHLPNNRRYQLFALVFFMVISSFAEIVSIGTVVPFLGVLIAPENIYNNPSFGSIISYFGIMNAEDLVLPITLIFIMAAIISSLVRIFVTWLNVRLSFKIGVDFSIKMFTNSLYQPYSTHVDTNSSEIINTITAKATGTIFNFLMPILTIISSGILVIAIMNTLIFINPLVAFYSFGGIGIIYLLISRFSSSKLESNGKIVANLTTKVIKTVQESLGGIRDVILDGTQKTFINVFSFSDKSLRYAQGTNLFIMMSPRYLLEGLSLVVIAIVAFFFSSTNNLEGTIPTLGAIALGAQKVLPQLQGIYASWSQMKGGEAILKDALYLLDQDTREMDLIDDEINFKKSIEISNISFSYSNSSKTVILNNFSHSIKKGTRTGIIGSTGSGKSTLVDIIMGLLTPSEGYLEVDGIKINPKNMHQWRSKIAHVPQSIFLIDTSITENIAFGVPQEDIDFDRIKEVADQAQISSFIESLPDAYNTNVGERGVKLSGGQRQRIGIARALYKNASLIIFDEATSALDSETEQGIMKSIENLSNDLTLIIIAHRISTLEQCDLILDLSSKDTDKKVKSYDEIKPL